MKKVAKKRTNWKRKFYASDLIRSALMCKVVEVKKELDLMDNAHSALLACYNDVSERARSLEKHNAILLAEISAIRVINEVFASKPTRSERFKAWALKLVRSGK